MTPISSRTTMPRSAGRRCRSVLIASTPDHRGGSAADFATALSRPPTAPAYELCVRKMRTGGSVADSFAVERCPYGAHRDHRIPSQHSCMRFLGHDHLLTLLIFVAHVQCSAKRSCNAEHSGCHIGCRQPSGRTGDYHFRRGWNDWNDLFGTFGYRMCRRKVPKGLFRLFRSRVSPGQMRFGTRPPGRPLVASEALWAIRTGIDPRVARGGVPSSPRAVPSRHVAQIAGRKSPWTTPCARWIAARS